MVDCFDARERSDPDIYKRKRVGVKDTYNLQDKMTEIVDGEPITLGVEQTFLADYDRVKSEWDWVRANESGA